MNTKNIDILNIGLILLSGILAFQFPLQLFIVVFAILGPLHYLTEINWLDKKDYFTNRKNRSWFWIGTIASILIVFPKIYFYWIGTDDSSLSRGVTMINKWSNAFIFLSFLLSIGFVFFKTKLQWFVLVFAGIVGALLLNGVELYVTIVGLLIPTVIHVYLFTLLFMLFGARKSNSKWGYISVGVALLVPLAFAYVDLTQVTYFFSEGFRNVYIDNNLHTTPTLIAKFLGLSDGSHFGFDGALEIRMMMFLSFIYTYHYLNWFSKTTLISWHKNLTIRSSATILIIWITMLVLFYTNFRLGFIVALFFSFLHVILEFPLNLVSIKGVFAKNKKE
ncbi:MAG: hypothetical protein QNK23_01055 [Crocinitomicaceae bacterium]|nr:hypothetical protein [Crocinitomicaceae bacterium]